MTNQETYQEPSARKHPLLPLEDSCVLAFNVTRLRTQQSMSKSTFSLVSGISRPTIIKVEKGCSDLKLSQIRTLADALGVTVADLLTPPKDTDMDAQWCVKYVLNKRKNESK